MTAALLAASTTLDRVLDEFLVVWLLLICGGWIAVLLIKLVGGVFLAVVAREELLPLVPLML
jgi:hypothetical protein